MQVPISFQRQKSLETGLEDSPDQFLDDRYICHYVTGLNSSICKPSLLPEGKMIPCKSFPCFLLDISSCSKDNNDDAHSIMHLDKMMEINRSGYVLRMKLLAVASSLCYHANSVKEAEQELNLNASGTEQARFSPSSVRVSIMINKLNTTSPKISMGNIRIL